DRTMKRLYVLYDDRCGLCRWVKTWAQHQPTFVELIFLPAGSREAESLFPGLCRPGEPEEVIAVGDEREVYRGDSVWIMCFYAMEEFREWSFRLASPELRPLARKAFAMLSRHRVRVSDWLGLTDREAVSVFGKYDAPACEWPASSLQKIHRMVTGVEPRDVPTGR
ncbi:MAG: DUF393 domain-containing protein, partial [Planctomycetia bacterium]|nr:DUF393 domain-containing protein [Planctomycetia bacterium]